MLREYLTCCLLAILIVCVLIALPGAVAMAKTVLHVQELNWGGGTEFYAETAKAFEQLHPDVRVEFINTGSRIEAREKIPLLAAAGTCPDVIVLQHRVKNSWLGMGLIEDISPYIERDPDAIEGFVPYAREFVTWNGRYWGLPESWEVWVAHINRDAFTNAGLMQPDGLYENGEWCFDRLIDLGRKLTIRDDDGTAKQIGMITNADNEVSYPWVWGYGGKVVNEDGTRMFLDSPEVKDGYQFFVDLLNDYRVANIIATPDGVGWGGFTGGAWGIAFWWSDLMYYLNIDWDLPYTFDLLPFPAGPRSSKTNLIGLCAAWSIFAASEKKDLAWSFIKYISSAETDRKRVLQRNLLPQRIDNIDVAIDHLGERATVKNLPLLFESLGTTGKPYNSLIDLATSRKFTELLNPVWVGEKPLAEALESAHGIVNRMLKGATR